MLTNTEDDLKAQVKSAEDENRMVRDVLPLPLPNVPDEGSGEDQDRARCVWLWMIVKVLNAAFCGADTHLHIIMLTMVTFDRSLYNQKKIAGAGAGAAY